VINTLSAENDSKIEVSHYLKLMENRFSGEISINTN
jgi:hypothetical protein